MRKKLLSLREIPPTPFIKGGRFKNIHFAKGDLKNLPPLLKGGEGGFWDADGFTLIELLIVFALFFLASTAGMVSFRNYTDSQTLNSAAKEFITFLNSARVNAVTQTVPSVCNQLSPGLVNYSVKITAGNAYEMDVYCNLNPLASPILKTKTLSNNVNFTTVPTEIFFLAGNGNSPVARAVTLNYGSSSKTIQIDTSGNITGL